MVSHCMVRHCVSTGNTIQCAERGKEGLFFFGLYLYILYKFIVPIGSFVHVKFGLFFPRGKPAAAESRYPR